MKKFIATIALFLLSFVFTGQSFAITTIISPNNSGEIVDVALTSKVLSDYREQIKLYDTKLNKNTIGKQYLTVGDAFIEKYKNDINTLSNLDYKISKIDTNSLKDENIVNFLNYLGAKVNITLLASKEKIETISKEVLYIDNPTDISVLVQVGDDISTTIGPKSHKEIDIKSGTHTLKVNGKYVGEFTKGELDGKKAFLNPTKSVYIKEKAVYLIDNSDANPEPYQDIEINGKVFNGPFYIYDDYYIKGEWTYGLDEILPDEIETYLDYEVKVKIYRYDDFVEMYEEYYGDY